MTMTARQKAKVKVERVRRSPLVEGTLWLWSIIEGASWTLDKNKSWIWVIDDFAFREG